jgi:hypothetical protein
MAMLRQSAWRPPDSQSKGRDQSHKRCHQKRNDTQWEKRDRCGYKSNRRKDCPLFPSHPTAQNAIKNDKTQYQPDRGTLYSALEKGKLKSRKVKAESG